MWLGRRLHEDLDAGEAIDRRAVRRGLAGPDLRRANAAGVHARRRRVLDAPPGAVGIDNVIEGAGRHDAYQAKEGKDRETTTRVEHNRLRITRGSPPNGLEGGADILPATMTCQARASRATVPGVAGNHALILY